MSLINSYLALCFLLFFYDNVIAIRCMSRQRGLSVNQISETLFVSKTFVKNWGDSIVRKHWNRKRSAEKKVNKTKNIR